MNNTDSTTRDITIIRLFVAPRDAVWRAWTDPEVLRQWFMPHGFTVSECTIDLRPGGLFHIVVRDPAGNDSTNDGKIVELEPPERLVMLESAFDGALSVRTEVTLRDAGRTTTELTLRAEVQRFTPELRGALAGMEEGWLQSFEKLDALLTGGEIDRTSRSVIATRVLGASRDRIWKAYTHPDELSRWWAPVGSTVETHEMDVRSGGMWRATIRSPHGGYEQRITYLAVMEPAALAYLYGDVTERGHAFSTIELGEDGDKTIVTVSLNFASREERRRMVEERSAQEGLEQSLDRLAAHVERS